MIGNDLPPNKVRGGGPARGTLAVMLTVELKGTLTKTQGKFVWTEPSRATKLRSAVGRGRWESPRRYQVVQELLQFYSWNYVAAKPTRGAGLSAIGANRGHCEARQGSELPCGGERMCIACPGRGELEPEAIS